MAKLVEKGVSKPPIPVGTRWNSQFEMFDHSIENWIAIVCIISELLPKNDKIYRYVEDIQLKRGASEIREVLQPINRSHDLLPRDDTSVSEATRVWKEFITSCPGAYKEFVVKRMDDELTPPLLAGYLLDHRYQGTSLTSTETEVALEYIRSFGRYHARSLAKDTPCNLNLFQDFSSSSPSSLWKLGLRLGFREEFGILLSLHSADLVALNDSSRQWGTRMAP